ncbi:MAG TPA: hypothetical protein DD723_08905 [Candidatus Omnitrophica bacterium]|nr:MAG: hypothetical protein A2Z81_08505 [Omnitrophica WOR_2 bacterium GWA2_45_18]OGX19358.1 MAG: hypothetical protein A2Y04_01970 [Omnitrophica WOR_2 bacterium GWC2_45_7]HBR15635.1 hypothetical protein [Candidatus Omnitrophota bacterium]
MENFIFKKVNPEETELLKQIYRLRLEVYGRECGFIKEEDYPEGLETDEYDEQSVHFAALGPGQEVIGTMRMILPGRLKLPIERHCPEIKVANEEVSGVHVAEISRLVISKRLRRRKNDGLFYEPQVEDKRVVDEEGREFLRRTKPMAFGLYRELYQESKRKGITHWYALMEKGLCLLLRIHGFAFVCIGPEVDVYGAVYPYLGKISQIEEDVRKKFPKFFCYFAETLETKHLES